MSVPIFAGSMAKGNLEAFFNYRVMVWLERHLR
jgi:hypothetical protein